MKKSKNHVKAASVLSFVVVRIFFQSNDSCLVASEKAKLSDLFSKASLGTNTGLLERSNKSKLK